MSKRRRTVEIYAPTLGIKADAPPEMLDPRAAATGQNFKCFFGVNQKEYGTSLWATATSAVFTTAPTFMFAATFPQISVLEVATPTNIYSYSSGSDNYAIDGQTFTGTYTDYWTGLMFDNKFIYTNGKDPMQIKSTYNGTGTNLASAITPTTFNAWNVMALNGILNLYHTFENGTEYFKRVRWSIPGPLTYTAGATDFATGIAGAQDIDDGEGNLMGACPLAGGAALYFENSIHFQNYVGGTQVWDFKKVVPGVGIPGRRCAFGYQEVNYLLTLQNIYRYYGGYYLDPIGDPIKRALFSEINYQYINTAWLEFDKKEAELLVYIPTGTSTSPDVCWVYRIPDKAWSRKTRNHASSTYFGRVSGVTIGQLVGPIGAQNYTYGDAAAKPQTPVKLYGESSGRVVKHDPSLYSVSVSGTQQAQNYIYETPDLTGNKSPDPVDGSISEFTVTNQRWQRLACELVGNGSGHIFYSVDHGNSFTELAQSPVSLVSTGTTHLLDMDVSSPYIRIRVQNSGLNEFIGVRYMKLDFVPGPQF